MELPWASQWIPKDQDSYKALSMDTWKKWFATLTNEYPQLLKSRWTQYWDLKKLNQVSKSELWKQYEDDADFSLLDLMFQSSRAFGDPVQLLSNLDQFTLRSNADLDAATRL